MKALKQFISIKACVHWRSLQAKMSAAVTDYKLALATMGSMTQIGSFLFQSLGQGSIRT